MNKPNLLIIIFLSLLNLVECQEDSLDLYLIPGQGADYRLFDSLGLRGNFRVHFIYLETPEKGESMNMYARKLALQIDTSRNFVLIGTSLGGMLAAEMASFLEPEKIILISSAKCRKELPLRYRFQKWFPLYEIFPPGVIKFGARTLQPIVEKDSKSNKETFRAMLKAKDPKFLKRTIRMIVNWDKKTTETDLIHIHGTKDRTIPIRNVDADYEIESGSHMITLTRAQELSAILNKVIRTSKS